MTFAVLPFQKMDREYHCISILGATKQESPDQRGSLNGGGLNGSKLDTEDQESAKPMEETGSLVEGASLPGEAANGPFAVLKGPETEARKDGATEVAVLSGEGLQANHSRPEASGAAASPEPAEGLPLTHWFVSY